MAAGERGGYSSEVSTQVLCWTGQWLPESPGAAASRGSWIAQGLWQQQSSCTELGGNSLKSSGAVVVTKQPRTWACRQLPKSLEAGWACWQLLKSPGAMAATKQPVDCSGPGRGDGISPMSLVMAQ